MNILVFIEGKLVKNRTSVWRPCTTLDKLRWKGVRKAGMLLIQESVSLPPGSGPQVAIGAVSAPSLTEYIPWLSGLFSAGSETGKVWRSRNVPRAQAPKASSFCSHPWCQASSVLPTCQVSSISADWQLSSPFTHSEPQTMLGPSVSWRREDGAALSLPHVLGWQSLVKYTKQQIVVRLVELCGARVSSTHLGGRPRLEATVKRQVWVLFRFCEKSSRGVCESSRKGCRQITASVQMECSPEHFTRYLNHLWSCKNCSWSAQETLSILLLLKEVSVVIHTISNV